MVPGSVHVGRLSVTTHRRGGSSSGNLAVGRRDSVMRVGPCELDVTVATATPDASVVYHRVCVGGVDLDPLDERQVVDWVMARLGRGQGGWIVTPNIDHLHKCSRDPALRALLGDADLSVPDGAPVVWAARLCGEWLPARVTGADLLWSLTDAAAQNGFSVYLMGGDPGVPEAAARVLQERCPGLVVTGTSAPPFGFDRDADQLAQIRRDLLDARPDLVFVGLGFPKQERVIMALHDALPGAWWLGCGAAIPFAAGSVRRAPTWMGRLGLEWVYRLLCEPRRLVRRYLVEDAPYAVELLLGAACRGVGRRWSARRTARAARTMRSRLNRRPPPLRRGRGRPPAP